MLVMMRAERGTKYIAAAEAAACRRICRACRGLVNGLGAADIDADVDDSKASSSSSSRMFGFEGRGFGGRIQQGPGLPVVEDNIFLFFFGCVDIAGCVLSEVPFRICP
jgi:hypothetical protein